MPETAFQRDVYKIIPTLKKIAITDAQWTDLEKNLTGKRLTSRQLFIALPDILNISYNDLQQQLKQQRTYALREQTNQLNKPIRIPYQRKIKDQQAVPLYSTTLAAPGIRQVPLQPLADNPLHLHTTPDGTPCRAIYTSNQHTIFKPVTPPDTATHAGSIVLSTPTTPIHNLPKPAQKTSFRVTLSTLEKSAERRGSQNAVMGHRCIHIFEKHGAVLKKPQHNPYHWSHLQAHFFGGSQSRGNLCPTTAAANYNTLDLIEKHVTQMLITHVTDYVDIDVIPVYQKAEFIPLEIKYHLTWLEKDENQQPIEKQETYHINTRSHRRVGRELEVIAQLRKLSLHAKPPTSPASSENTRPTGSP